MRSWSSRWKRGVVVWLLWKCTWLDEICWKLCTLVCMLQIYMEHALSAVWWGRLSLWNFKLALSWIPGWKIYLGLCLRKWLELRKKICTNFSMKWGMRLRRMKWYMGFPSKCPGICVINECYYSLVSLICWAQLIDSQISTGSQQLMYVIYSHLMISSCLEFGQDVLIYSWYITIKNVVCNNCNVFHTYLHSQPSMVFITIFLFYLATAYQTQCPGDNYVQSFAKAQIRQLQVYAWYQHFRHVVLQRWLTTYSNRAAVWYLNSYCIFVWVSYATILVTVILQH